MKQWMLLGLLGLGAVAQAHDVWVATDTSACRPNPHADLGYSHDFPMSKKSPTTACIFSNRAINRQLKENR